jgi:Tol biopolymer transport system component
VSISPEGNRVAFIGTHDGVRQVYLRALDSSEAKPLAGTEGAYCTPVFSPDGQWLAFFSPDVLELKKISIQGGPPVTLVKAGGMLGACWGSDDTIIYAEGPPGRVPGLQRVSSAGGKPEWITHVDSTKGETAHRWPIFLPGGKAFLFAIEKGSSPNDAQIVVQRLDTGQRRLLVQGGTFPQYVPAGYLVYVLRGRLMAAPLDVRRLQVKGPAVPLDENVQETSAGAPATNAAQFGLSPEGSLVYVPAPGGVQAAQRRLVWISRNGTEQSLAAPAHAYLEPRLSPDGRRVAVTLEEQEIQIWLYDLSRETLTRLTSEGGDNPVWTPDGKRIAFRSRKEGPLNLFWQPADGSGGLERLTNSEHVQAPDSWSPDGQLLAFTELNPTTGRDIWVLRLSDRKPQPFLRTPSDESAPRFSPDGRWLAYVSNESGRYETYVQPYPGPGGKWQISTEGGTEPVWNPNGRELFYRSGGKMMVVDITTQPSFAMGRPRMLFEGGQYGLPTGSYSYPFPNYDVSPDGQRFLMITKESKPQINVVLNWFEELKQKVPAGKK